MGGSKHKKKTGLFFGSFNPIHNGHLSIASFIIKEGFTNEVWFVVSPLNPLKSGDILLEGKQRLELVRLAVENSPGIDACDIEFSLPKPSYTFNTLKKLKEKHPDRDFYLIMGADNLEIFHKWRNFEDILEEFRILVYPRTGSESSSLLNHRNVTIVNAPFKDVSSTEIRDKIKGNKNIDDLIPSCIADKIKKLYCDFL